MQLYTQSFGFNMKAWGVTLIFIGVAVVFGFMFGGAEGAGSFGAYGSVIGIIGYLVYRATKPFRKKSDS